MGATNSSTKRCSNKLNSNIYSTPPKLNNGGIHNRVVQLQYDPRSPSDGISRTPIQVDSQLPVPPSRLYNHVMPHIVGPNIIISEVKDDENNNNQENQLRHRDQTLTIIEHDVKRSSGIEPLLDPSEKWQSVENHQLLWHGSRKTNFAGILSQGLRIAPPEAPKTDYNFGKGVYFADMVAKSAHYCFPTPQAFQGLMLLSEVALGKMYECYQKNYLSAETLPSGTQSVKACGERIPDPNEQYISEDGIIIPMGHGIDATNYRSSMSYDEFIVYNTDQFKMKYLLRIDFNFIN